ncbi:peptide chain release factor-like protein, partial [Nonomuraea sp. NPDC004297]
MPGPLVVNDSIVIPDIELVWRFSRSSGPGGQGVNTTDSRVELTFDVAASIERVLDRISGYGVTGVT